MAIQIQIQMVIWIQGKKSLIQQQRDPSAPATAIVPTSDGITIKVTNKMPTTPLRIQIQGIGGRLPKNDDARWCVNVSGSGFYSWSQFTNHCWDSESPGNTYKMEPLEFVAVIAAGDISDARSFDFCIDDIIVDTQKEPEDTDTGNDPDDTEQSLYEYEGTICSKIGNADVRRADTYYRVLNNIWNGENQSQCISYFGTTFTVTKQSGSSATNGAPVSYPSVIYGVKTASEKTYQSILPVKVSDLGKVTTHWSHNAGSSSGQYNAAYDVWFNSGSNDGMTKPGDTLPTGAYLMLWMHAQGCQPLGSKTQTVTIGSISWDVWEWGTGPSGAKHIAYSATSTKTNTTLDLKDFIDDAVKRGVVSSSMYLSAVQAGFEIWSGGTGLKTKDFWIDNIE